MPRRWALLSVVWAAVLVLRAPVPASSVRSEPLAPLLRANQGPSTWDLTAGTVLSNVSKDVVLQFIPSNQSHVLTHVAIDVSNDDVYLGAVNRLYQLDGVTMKPIYQVVTGPRLDSAGCHATGCDSDIRKSLTDNYNKVLVVAPSTESVIACGSVSQGACDTYRRGNLSVHNEYIPRSVAANDPHSSTFAFIGPERYSTFGESEALYIGTTFTSLGDYRHDVPAIATRNLVDLDFSKFTFSEQSLLRIDVKYRDHFLVKYIYGFNASNYVYFLTVQKKSHLPGQEEAGFISRISRICISDDNYDSYTEISLECHGPHGVSYNLVQDATIFEAGEDLAANMGIYAGDEVMAAAFSKSQGHTDNPQEATAVCLYSVKEIDARFNENIHMCFNGSRRYRSMEYISGTILDGKCPRKWSTGNIQNFCDVGLKISGSAPLTTRSALRLNNTLVTSIMATSAGTHSVAFMGTSVGSIKKVLLSSSEQATEYSEVPVDPGNAVLKDMSFTRDMEFLYVLSKYRASKVAVQSCASYADCSTCLQARDPYCGWCSLEKRCTVAAACVNAGFSSPRWLNFRSGQQCIDFEAIDPDGLPLNTVASLIQLTIRTLPELPAGAKYQCVWGAAPPTDAQVTSTGLTCPAPALRHRPSIPPRTDHTLVPLAVRSSETNKDFVSRNFAFYDCSRHSTCGSCVRSAWACNWCVYENTCTHNSSTCGGTVVSGENNPAQLSTHGAGFCPRFWRKEDELLAPDGAPTELSLSVRNLPVPHPGQSGFQCLVSIEGATMLVSARVVQDGAGIVVCESTVYRYQAMTAEYGAHLTLVWNRDHVVDSRSLTLYKCGVLGAHRGHADCSLCVTRPPRYRCSWCGGTCNFAASCPAAARPLLSPHHEDQSLLTSDACPTPRIDMIYPLAGPVEGGTLVTIEGSNLGLREEDVHNNVFIGDVPCTVHAYHVSVKIICRTSPAPSPVTGDQDLQYPVRVTTPAGTTHSTVKFSYTNISVSGVWPATGPVSGGTTLSISGRFLNVGSEVSASLDNLPCIVNKTQSSSQRLVCVTSGTQLTGSDGAGSGYPLQIRTLTVNLDSATRTLQTPYTYTPDPRIVELKPLRSTWNGGRMITVHGSNLNSIQAPRITVLYNEQILNSSICFVHSHALMECPSPTLDQAMVLALLEQQETRRRKRRSKSEQITVRSPRRIEYNFEEAVLDLGFIMDGVMSVRHLRKYFPEVRSHVTYVPNPVYYPFPDGIKLYKGDTLVIEGEYINSAADESDVRVTIGTSTCNLTSLAGTQLVCTPPGDQPSPTDELGITTAELLPLVVVHVGRYQRYPLGILRYERHRHFPLSPEGIAGLAAGALFLVIASFVVLAICRRKSSQAERVYKLMQLQMDSLESHVRTECKQAFAELQTDMTDLTADLQASGMPSLDRRTYIMKVFFPGVTDHPILNEPKSLSCGRSNYDVAMLQLEQLVLNKHFLVALVDTLEAQKTFSIRDKVNVGSLLTVLLLGRMEYLTEVLRLLLGRLIFATAANKHPQLMLRRTETVVEKMLTNWFALTMFNYLKGEAGNSLFLLYKALKHQVEKGPVDAVTHDARYCLSEERLLREQITHSPVTIHLLHDDPHYEKIPYQTTYSTLAAYSEDLEEKLQVKVLDCDTISQVKAKIMDALYRNSPQSIRPSVHDLDLEWRCGRAGRVTLSDYDRTSALQGEWRQVNTLQHYGVKDSAVMALLPRQTDNSYASSNCTGHYSYANSVSPLAPPPAGMEPPEAPPRNVYHIVRPSDDPASSGREQTYSTHKAIPEIFLTRLLSTKGTIQQFVDDFFRTILSPNDSLPPPVKWLFDLLDSQAQAHGITDPEVIHAWKSNCLPLRFWVNFIKNPDFVFDINKSPTVEASLSVIAQTFIDSCSTTEHRLGKDSPSNKLLFAKDIPRYRTQVKNYYRDIASAQPVSDQELGQLLQQMSSAHVGLFNNLAALKELYIYISKYHMPILESLEADPYCRKLNLSHRLQSIAYIVESYSHSGPVSPLPPSQHPSSPSHLQSSLLAPLTQLTSAHLATLPHLHPTSSSGHIITSMPHVTSSPHLTYPPQHLVTTSAAQQLASSVSNHGHLSSQQQGSPLHHLNPTCQPEYHHQHHGSTSSSSHSHHTLPSNSSSQLSEL